MKHSSSLLLSLILLSCHSESKKTTNVPKDTVIQAPVLSTENPPSLERTDADTVLPDFAFVAENNYIILSSTPDTNLVKGVANLASGDDSGAYASVTDVDASQLPAVYTRMLNRKVRLCGNSDTSYFATIMGFKIYSSFIPHFGQVQGWNGENGDGSPAFGDRKKALEIRNSAAHFLVAEFYPDKVSYNRHSWYAVPAYSPRPVTNAVSAKDPDKAVAALLYKTKDYTAVQKEYAILQKGNWWEDQEKYVTWNSYSFNNNDKYTTVCHSAGNACGGDFYAEKFSIWKTSNNGAPVLLYMEDGSFTVVLAADIDGDNIPEFFINEGFGKKSILKKKGNEWVKYYTWVIPYQDTPC